MRLLDSLRLPSPLRLALTGAGGKTSALFALARQLPPPVILTATTHLGVEQMAQADRVARVSSPADVSETRIVTGGVTLFAGGDDANGRVAGLEGEALARVHALAERLGCPLIVEADGSRRLPLKAPAEHEPPVPDWASAVLVIAGLSGLGAPLVPERIHRAERFAALSGLQPGAPVTIDALAAVLLHPLGGLKGIPAGAKRLALLNQADDGALAAQGGLLAEKLLAGYERVLVGRLRAAEFDQVGATFTPVAGILLAAGGSSRLGEPKQLLDYFGEPFVRRAARIGLAAGLSPLVVVTGSGGEAVASALHGLPVTRVHNPGWAEGQAGSIRAGLAALPETTGAAVFLLSDQPQVTPEVIRALVETHRAGVHPVVAPLVQDRRANPVLFDRATFTDLLALQGDVGGRAVFSKHRVSYLPWADERLLLDVDTPGDYVRLLSRSDLAQGGG